MDTTQLSKGLLSALELGYICTVDILLSKSGLSSYWNLNLASWIHNEEQELLPPNKTLCLPFMMALLLNIILLFTWYWLKWSLRKLTNALHNMTVFLRLSPTLTDSSVPMTLWTFHSWPNEQCEQYHYQGTELYRKGNADLVDIQGSVLSALWRIFTNIQYTHTFQCLCLVLWSKVRRNGEVKSPVLKTHIVVK